MKTLLLEMKARLSDLKGSRSRLLLLDTQCEVFTRLIPISKSIKAELRSEKPMDIASEIEQSRAFPADLCPKLGVKKEDLLASSYADLLLEKEKRQEKK